MSGFNKGWNRPTSRLAMNLAAPVGTLDLSEQLTTQGDSTGFEATGGSHFETSVLKLNPRAAQQARIPAGLPGLQYRTGQKRSWEDDDDDDDDDEEAKSGEPLHKRLRTWAGRQEYKWTRPHERTSGTRARDDDAVKHAEVERSSREGRWVSQYSSSEDRSRHQERGNLGIGAVESSRDATAEAKQRWKSADVESFGIAPLNTTRRSSGILQDSVSLRPKVVSLKKKVRFEDETSAKALEKPASLSKKFNETPKEQLARSEPQILNATQPDTVNQPADVDVIMTDV